MSAAPRTVATRQLLAAAARAVPRRAVALHLAAAVALLIATSSGLDDHRTAVAVLRGVAVLLAATVALAVDETGAALLDASPTSLRRRIGARAALCCVAVLPLWGVALSVVDLRGAQVPAVGLTLELTALTALGLAVPAALRRWRGIAEPAVVTGPLLLGGLLAASRLPPDLALLPSSSLDPSWHAAHQRWSVLLLTAVAVLLVAAGDPATARVRRRPRPVSRGAAPALRGRGART